ncbi:MAG: SDR family oxidoreductase [Verrucomicrobia bacterium]|nr:SDR family oxidoreductase [Verrucomicrobiota bacterium]
MGKLTGKSLVVVGGTTGMGWASALAFVREGARIVAVGRDGESVADTAKALGDSGVAFAGDAAQPQTAAQAIQVCCEKFGGFHGLFHVAGGSGRKFGDGPLHEVTDEAIQATLDLNLKPVILSNRAAIRSWLEKNQGGVILNMGSVLADSPSPAFFSTHIYATAKAAIAGLSRSLAACYARHNIRVNVLAPGLIDTPMARRAATDPAIQQFIATKQPLDGGRMGRIEDIEAAAVFLMSDGARFVTGQVLAVDGGWGVSEGQIP